MEIIVISNGSESRAAFDDRFSGVFNYTFYDALPSDDVSQWEPHFAKSDIYDFPWRIDKKPTIARGATHFNLWKEKRSEEIVVLDDTVEWWGSNPGTSQAAFLDFLQTSSSLSYDCYYLDAMRNKTYVTNIHGLRVYPGKAYALRPSGAEKLIASIEEKGFRSSVGWEIHTILFTGLKAPVDPIFISNAVSRFAVKNEVRPIHTSFDPTIVPEGMTLNQTEMVGEPLPLYFPKEYNDWIKNNRTS